MPTTTTPVKKSELWQRIRAARAYGKKTAEQVAVACGVTRPAVSLWESRMPENRSQPSTQHLVEIARLCGVSPQYLLDDSATTEDIYTYGTVESIRSPRPEMGVAERQARAGRAFWSAVRFQIISERPEMEDCFDVPVVVAGVPMTIDFLCGDNLVYFGQPTVSNDGLAREVGHLLVLERAAGHPYRKHLFRWSATPNATVPRLDKVFEVDLRSFTDVPEAARTLQRL